MSVCRGRRGEAGGVETGMAPTRQLWGMPGCFTEPHTKGKARKCPAPANQTIIATTALTQNCRVGWTASVQTRPSTLQSLPHRSTECVVTLFCNSPGLGQAKIPHALMEPNAQPGPTASPMRRQNGVLTVHESPPNALCRVLSAVSVASMGRGRNDREQEKRGTMSSPTVFQPSSSISFHRMPPYLILLIGFGKVGIIWNNNLNNCAHNSSSEKQITLLCMPINDSLLTQ